MEERRGTGFIRDLIIKIFLILLFVFLITLLFPMPNLTPFYNRIFNDNVQTMKDAAEDYFTKDRMPQNVGDSSKLTLQQMLDKKLVLPFLDKDGKECDTNKSYVKVTKKKTEYELEVHLTCGNESNYIIEPIGCYNFCPDNSCTKEVETKEDGTVVINKEPTTTPTEKKQYTPDGKYKLQYLYTRTLTDTKWVTGDWTTTRQNETSDVKLVDTKVQYTGKKKISAGTTIYKHERTTYTDNWTYDKDWTDEVKQITDKVKLADTRTLYTGQRRYSVDKTMYKHVRTVTKDNWTETGYQENKYKETDKVKLIGKKYKVRKTVKTTTGGWSAWTKDTTWRTSKQANTDTKQWSDAYNKRTTTSTSNKLIYSSYESTTPLKSTGNRIYEFLYYDDVPCKSSCTSATTRIYYYRVYEVVSSTTTEYQYMYRTYSSSSTTNTDEKWVTDPDPYTKDGYTIVGYLYNYKINKPTTTTDEKWTDSITPPAGYTYANEKKITRTTKYENLDKWVTTPGGLGEYTYNVVTRKQYKYKYNNPTAKTDYKWTTSINPPAGYKYTGIYHTDSKDTYVDLGRWVDSRSELGEYTHSIQTRTLYKYTYRKTTTTSESKWFDKNPGGDWVYTGQSRKVKVN